MKSITSFIVLCVFMFIVVNHVKGQGKPTGCQVGQRYRGKCGADGTKTCLNDMKLLKLFKAKRCDCSEMLGKFQGWHFCTCYSGRPGC
ncbi:PREDICTED: putative defensin-like protein 238 [Camelina sativa]|uniref:Defensin-like protein 238 n=1 Tax=Camelina sativa TaxID=90675 RepID=A0ABM1RCT4_CAMSA|nr:PREDICTED: putative defensin-like protein 238 [Camelina sativa]